MKSVLKTFLRAKGVQAAQQIIKAINKVEKGENEPTGQEVQAILDSLDLAWDSLPLEIIPILKQLVIDSVKLAAQQVSLTDTKALDLANENAINFVKGRGAEMVGMKWVDGELITNPRAEWSIAESTRDMLRSTVQQAMEEGWSNNTLAEAIQDSAAFSPERAEMIARTETAIADVQGNMIAYKEAQATGIELKKKWVTANDDLVSEDCAANGEQEPIGLDEVFQSGEGEPPDHPNCRCDILPCVIEEGQ